VEYWRWGSRNVLLTFVTEIAAGALGSAVSAAGREIVVDKGY
jgi:hypothetical protein